MARKSANGAILFASPDIVIKSGATKAGELGLRLVQRHTSIPVPTIHRTFWTGFRHTVIMSRVQGRTLASAWQDLGFIAKLRVAWTLRGYISQLRTLRSSVPGPLD